MLIAVVTLASLIVFMPTAAQAAAPTIAANQQSAPSVGIISKGVAQSFKATRTGALSRVDLQVWRDQIYGPVTVGIYNFTPGSYSLGSALATVTYGAYDAGAPHAASNGILSTTFSPAPTLTAGVTYAIYVQATSFFPQFYYDGESQSNPYPDGYALRGYSNNLYPEASTDLWFRTYMPEGLAIDNTATTAVVGHSVNLVTRGGYGNGVVTWEVTTPGAGCSVAADVLTATSEGACGVKATMAADGTYAAEVTSEMIFTFRRSDQSTLALLAPGGAHAWGDPFTLVTTGGLGTGAVSYDIDSSTQAGCFLDLEGRLSSHHAGSCSVTATRAGDNLYNPVSSQAVIFAFDRVAQTPLAVANTAHTFPFSPSGALALEFSGGSGLGEVTYETTGTAGCSIGGSAGAFTLVYTTIGTCSVTATKAEDLTYSANASAPVDFTIEPTAQSPLELVPSDLVNEWNHPRTLAATGGSGSGALLYLIGDDTAGCALMGEQLSASGVGWCDVSVSKDAADVYSSARSTPVRFIFEAIPPAVGSLTAIVGDNNVRLDWQTPAALVGFDLIALGVERASFSGDTQMSPYSSTGASCEVPLAHTWCVDSAVDSGATYRYRIRAIYETAGGARYSVYTESTSVTPHYLPAVAAIASIGAQPVFDLDTGEYLRYDVTVSWAPSTDAYVQATTSTVDVYDSISGWTELCTSEASSCSFPVSAYTPTSYYRVRSGVPGTDGRTVDYSAPSEWAVFDLSAPSATNLTSSQHDTTATLTWMAPDIASLPNFSATNASLVGYRLQRRTGSDNFAPLPDAVSDCAGILATQVLRCTDTGLTHNVTYDYQLLAVYETNSGQVTSSGITTSVTPLPLQPDAPTGVTAVASDGIVTVSWTAPEYDGGSPLVGYRVFMRAGNSDTWDAGSSGCSPELTSISLTTSCVYSAFLTDGQGYSYRVVALNSVGLVSSESSVDPPAQTVAGHAPSAPDSIIAVAGNSEVTLKWTIGQLNGRPLQRYRVFQAINSDSRFEISDYCTWGTERNEAENLEYTTCLVTGLSNTVSYNFAVSAVTELGEGPVADAGTSVPFSVPEAPAKPAVVAGYRKVTVSWNEPQGNGRTVTGYRIERTQNDVDWTSETGGSCAESVSSVSTAITCDFDGWPEGVAYKFRVTAINLAGAGRTSVPSEQVTPFGLPGPVAAPSGEGLNHSISLRWGVPASPGTPITGYVIQYRATGGDWLTAASGCSRPSATDPNQQVCILSGLVNGTVYQARIAGVNAGGTGEFSEIIDELEPQTTVPGAPEAVNINRGSTMLFASWNESSYAAGKPTTQYEVEVSIADEDSPFRFLLCPKKAGSRQTCTISGLTNGVSYRIRVAAVNVLGRGDLSTASNEVIPAKTAGVPALITATPGNATVSLRWAPPSDDGGLPVTGYSIKRALTSTGPWVVETGRCASQVTTVATSVTCKVEGLSLGTKYFWRVAAVTELGVGVPGFTSATTFAPPGQTRAVVVTSTVKKTINVTWQVPLVLGGLPINGYDVWISKYNNRGFVLATAGSCTTSSAFSRNSCTIFGTSGGAYYVRVSARNNVGLGPMSPASARVVIR